MKSNIESMALLDVTNAMNLLIIVKNAISKKESLNQNVMNVSVDIT